MKNGFLLLLFMIFAFSAKAFYNGDEFETDEYCCSVMDYNGKTGAYIYKYKGDNIEVKVPSTVKWEDFGIMIGEFYVYAVSGFENKTKLEKVILPSTVKEIGMDAFAGCTNLKEVVLPSKLDFIGHRAFSGCVSLSNFKFPVYTSTGIGDSAFEGCKTLTSLVLPSSIKNIGEACFKGCISLAAIELPSKLECIGSHAFEGCQSLAAIDFPSKLECIGSHAFEGCQSLVDLKFPQSLLSIYDHAFKDCVGLTEIDIPEKIQGLGLCAFSGCINLERVYLPENFKVLNGEEFWDCGKLSHIYSKATYPPYFQRDYEKYANGLNNLPQYLQVVVPHGSAKAYLESWGAVDTPVNISESESLDFHVIEPVISTPAGYMFAPEYFCNRAISSLKTYEMWADVCEISDNEVIVKEEWVYGLTTMIVLEIEDEYGDKAVSTISLHVDDANESVLPVAADVDNFSYGYFDMNGINVGKDIEALAPGIYLFRERNGRVTKIKR